MTCTFFTPKANWKHAVLHTWAPNRHAWSLFAAWKRGNFLLSRCLLHNIRQEISLPSRKNTLPTSNLHTRTHPKGSNPQHVKCSNFSPRINFIKRRNGIICEYLVQHKIKGLSFVWPLNRKTPRCSYALNVCVPSYFLLGAKSRWHTHYLELTTLLAIFDNWINTAHIRLMHLNKVKLIRWYWCF